MALVWLHALEWPPGFQGCDVGATYQGDLLVATKCGNRCTKCSQLHSLRWYGSQTSKVTLPGRPSGSSSQRDGCDGGAADQQRDGPEGGAAPQGHGSAAIPPRERSKGDLAGRSFWKCGNPMQPSRSVPFTEQIQENFLFLKSSSCAIHKVNYTVQSHTTTYLDISNRKLNKSNSHEKFNYGLKLSGPKSLENNIESKEVSFLSRLSPKEKKKNPVKKRNSFFLKFGRMAACIHKQLF